MDAWSPLHSAGTGVEHHPALSLVLVLGGLTSVVILTLAVFALTQRQSWSYLLVTLAIGTLGLRVALGGLMLVGLIDLPTHHLMEHAVDLLMAGLLLGAVYAARTGDRPTSE